MNGVGIAGRNGIPKGLVDNHWNTFAPRVGFAYDLTGHQKTVLRGGAGMFYERLAGNEMYNIGQNNVPFAFQSAPTNVYFNNPATSYTTGQTATAPYFPANITTVDPTYKIPTAVQWSLGIQQQLRDNAVLTVAYVGNSNYHQSEGININTLPQNDPHRQGVCGSQLRLHRGCLKCQPLPAVSGMGKHRPHGDGSELQLQFAAGQLADHGVEEPDVQHFLHLVARLRHYRRRDLLQHFQSFQCPLGLWPSRF